MTIQELRRHQIVVQDPAIDRAEYDAVMKRLREFWEGVMKNDWVLPEKTIIFSSRDSEWWSCDIARFRPPLTFSEFMNLQIEK